MNECASAPRFVTVKVTSAGRPDVFEIVNANSLGFPAVTVTTGASSVASLAAEAVQQARPTETVTTEVAKVDRQPSGDALTPIPSGRSCLGENLPDARSGH